MAINIGEIQFTMFCQSVVQVWQLIDWEDGFWGHFLELHEANPSLSLISSDSELRITL